MPAEKALFPGKFCPCSGVRWWTYIYNSSGKAFEMPISDRRELANFASKDG